MRVIVIFQLTFLFFHSALSAQEKNKLSLTDAISIALEENFQIRLADNQREIASNNNTLGNAGFLPTLDVTGTANITVENTTNTPFNGEEETIDGARTEFYNARANLSWTLFDGTRMFVTKDRLEQVEILNDIRLKNQIEITLAQVMITYEQAVLENERLKLFESSLEFSEERLRIIQQKYEAGKASKLEFLQAKVDFNSDRSSLVTQQEIFQNRQLNLLELLASEDYPNYELDSLSSLDTTLIYEELLNQLEVSNLSLEEQRFQQSVAELESKERLAERWPIIDFNLGYDYTQLEAQVGFFSTRQSSGLNYGLSARANIFNGFNQQREIQNARLFEETSKLNYEATRNQLTTRLRAAYITYSNNLNLLNLETENLEVARENSQIALDRFRIGVTDALEIREAQLNLVNSEIRFLEAHIVAKVAEIELKRLSGSLLKSS
ncbi:MAG: TolC family protein [Bacteroidota bacterium]